MTTRLGRICAALVSGLLLYFTVGLTPYWAAAWVAPIPLLLAVLGAQRGEASLLCWGAALVGLSANLPYYFQTTGPVAAIILILLQALAWVFYVNGTRRTMLRWRSWWVVFVLPVLMAAMDLLVGRFSPHGSWGSLALTQVEFLPVMQVASFAGSAGVVFLIGLFASAVVLFVYRRWDVQGPVLAYGLPMLVLLSSLGFGYGRIADSKPSASAVVGMVAVDAERGNWPAYAERTRELVKRGAEMVVWPEKIERLDAKQAVERQTAIGTLARELGVSIVMGVQVEKRNVAWTFGPDGGWIGEYQKQQLVPYLEGDLEAGHRDASYVLRGHRFGVAVCRDMMFSVLGRRYGVLGVEAMLVPAWDFYRDAWMASALVTLRGIEGGYGVVRAGRESYLHASDRSGRVLVQERSAALPGVGVIAHVPVGKGGASVYAVLGDWFGWLCVMMAGVIVLSWIVAVEEKE